MRTALKWIGIGIGSFILFLIGVTACVTVFVDAPADDDGKTTLVITTTETETEGDAGEAATTTVEESAEPAIFAVAQVTDGDTIRLRNGKRVRLVQIDAPELREGECYAKKSATALRSLLPRGTEVRLERDRRLDDVDQYGRLLRYVHKGEKNVNLALTQRGAASVWFFEGDRGKYAGKLLRATREARRTKKGLWRACSATLLDPFKAVTSKAPPKPPPPSEPTSPPEDCAEGYDPCLPVTDDLDCGEIDDSLKPVRVIGSDSYRLDSDNNSVGCESD